MKQKPSVAAHIKCATRTSPTAAARNVRHVEAPGDGGCGLPRPSGPRNDKDGDVSAVGAAIGRPPEAPAAGMRSISIVVTLLLAGILLWSILSIRSIPSSQTMQNEADRWQGPSEQAYAQVSVFWNEGEMDAGQAQMLSEELRSSFPTEEVPPFVTAWGAKSSGLAVYAHRRAEAELCRSPRISLRCMPFPWPKAAPGPSRTPAAKRS